MASAADARDLDPEPGSVDRFLDNLPVAIFRATAQGRIVYANRETARVLGYDSVRQLSRAQTLPGPDRDVLFEELSSSGQVAFLPVYWRACGDRPVLCAVSARAARDEGGQRFADGVLRPLWGAPLGVGTASAPSIAPVPSDGRVTVILDGDGKILNINAAGAAFFKLERASLVGRSVHEVILPVYQDLVGIFLSDVLDGSRKKGSMTVRDGAGAHRTIEFTASLEDRPGGGKRIRCTALESLPHSGGSDEAGERLRHAQEIAGGLAHLMNQPLTILSNLIQDLVSRTPPQDPRAGAIEEICWQLAKLTDIVAKIRNIHRYEVMDYVAGVRILDLERAS